VERVFGGDLPSCNRTMPVVPFGGWIKLKKGIVVELREGRDSGSSGPMRTTEEVHPSDNSRKKYQ
jgi:hypothetical protein